MIIDVKEWSMLDKLEKEILKEIAERWRIPLKIRSSVKGGCTND